MVRIKICGVTTPEDARLAADAGADAVGLNFYPKSPRFVTPTQAAAIVRALPRSPHPSASSSRCPCGKSVRSPISLGYAGVQTYDSTPPTEDPFPFAHRPGVPGQGCRRPG